MVKEKFNGLVLAGGKSSRMGQDKSLIKYHGITQLEHAHQLLSKFCQKVYVSARREQKGLKNINNFLMIYDLKDIEGQGPMSGIISALKKDSKVSWIILACDLPFINDHTIENLISKRDKKKLSTAYKSSYDQLPEPLCAIYEPRALKYLLNSFKEGNRCPRKFLLTHQVHLIEPIGKNALENINTPEEYKKAKVLLKDA